MGYYKYIDGRKVFFADGYSKRSCIKAARELGYDQKYIDQLKAAKSTNECALIMERARYAKWD